MYYIIIALAGFFIGSIVVTMLFAKFRLAQRKRGGPSSDKEDTSSESPGSKSHYDPGPGRNIDLENLGHDEFQHFMRELQDSNVTPDELYTLVDLYNVTKWEIDAHKHVLKEAADQLGSKFPQEIIDNKLGDEYERIEKKERYSKVLRGMIEKLRFIEPDFIDDDPDYDPASEISGDDPQQNG